MDIILENEQRLNIEIYNDAFKIKIFKSFQIFSKKFYFEELITFKLFKFIHQLKISLILFKLFSFKIFLKKTKKKLF